MSKGVILDLGTNTFNYVLFEKHEKGFNILREQKKPVKLGKGLSAENKIQHDAIARAIKALNEYAQDAIAEGVDDIRAFATSAVRDAKNRAYFVEEIKKQTGIQVDIISGDKEAELIYLGVLSAVHVDEKPFLILDIGGGSNELIIADRNEIFWKKSYPLGIARLLEQFLPSDPIKPTEIETIKDYLFKELIEFREAILAHPVHKMIGASGSFETVVSMLLHERHGNANSLKTHSEFEIPLKFYRRLSAKVLNATLQERLAFSGIHEFRAEMVPLAMIFTGCILDIACVSQLIYSDYSLKEGAIRQF